MQVIPVIDLLRGLAVHAIAGERGRYLPLNGIATRDGDPIELAVFYAARNPSAIYLADLDAILGGVPQINCWCEIARKVQRPLWIDCGVRSADDLKAFLELQAGGDQVHLLILGSETLRDVSQLSRIASRLEPSRLILSVDRKNGQSLAQAGANAEMALLEEAQSAGIDLVIALDLAAVGNGRAERMVENWRPLLKRFPGFKWVLGGGICGPEDLIWVAKEGFQTVLSATAILEGRL